MPDAKSLLPGRAFRSEHAQLRPEPHSIASHGPAPMDPLQTTRMRNGVLYAAEWPCCHDPLRLSLGSEDPFYNPRVRRARLRTPPPGCARPPRAPSACASPARGEACAQRKSLSLPATPPAARALRRARGGVASPPKRTSVSFHRRRTAHPISSPPTCWMCPLLPSPPARSQPDLTLARRSSRPRPPSFVIPYLPVNSPRTTSAQPPAHTHAHRSLAPPSLETAPQYSGRAAAARNRAAGSTPAARTPPTHTGCLASPKRAGVSFPPRRPSPNLGLRASPLSSLCTLLHPYPTLLSSATTALYPPQTLDLDYRV